MKLALTTFVIAFAVAGTALAAPNNATLVIRHEMHGCHAWSLDGTNWSASQKLSIVRGGVLTVVDNDVMPHTLVEVSGPKATMTGVRMGHMHAAANVAFPAKGTYVFKTKAGEDYMPGIKTVGEDNVLRLVVRVS